MPKQTVIADGTFDFSGGVNSDAVTTLQSELNPNGLRRNQLAWLNNGTVRGGSILQRTGFLKLFDLLKSGLYQGGIIYETFDNSSNPRLIVSVSGHIYSMLLDPPYTITDLSVKFGLFNPPTVDEAFFVEAEGILCIQAGDFLTAAPATLPLFYRSPFGGQPEIMRRSNGLTGNVTYPNINEIPAAMAMEYWQGRLWYAQGRTYTAGDIVGNQTSGTAPYNFRDSVFKVTENPLAVGGDGFTLPSQAGNIRALKFSSNIDSALGQGPLYIFTRKQVYSLNVPISRTAWIAANNTNQPLQTVVQINNGASGARGIVHVNGDLYYQSMDPAIRSLLIATRYFEQPGNIPISRNVMRALQFVDRSIMRFDSSIEFDNRALFGTMPKQTNSGVVSQGILALNFDPQSSLEDRKPAVWEGILEGVNTLQMFTGDFGGRQRAFAVVVDEADSTLDVWELTDSSRTDFGDNRVGWFFESPAFTWGTAGYEVELKKLHGGEIWVDKIFGTVDVKVEYRPDADPCWHLWHATQICAARNCAEDVNNPVCYPVGPNFREGYEFPITLPEPPISACSPSLKNRRPSNLGFQFQIRVTIKGWMRVRGILLYAEIKERALGDGLNC